MVFSIKLDFCYVVYVMPINFFIFGLSKKGKQSSSSKNLIEIDEKKCPHHFGYLSKLKKDSLIPEECLVCEKVLKCIQA